MLVDGFPINFYNRVMDLTFAKEITMSIQTHIFKPTIARRVPDPVFKKQYDTERHIFVMNVRDLPINIRTDSNARKPNINKQVYKVVEDSLLNLQAGSEPNTFHLKNKGITIIADSVEPFGDHEYKVHLDINHGIVDGGHTYKLITEHILADDLPLEQYVMVEIRTGIKQEWIQDISGGLNTGVQVQAMSLDNLSGMFEQIKGELRKHGLDKSIAWSENDDGEFNARDIISLMLCFNIELYNNSDASHPVEAYSSKSSALKKFEEKTSSFNRMKPLIKDILELHDIINTSAGEIWNTSGGKTGSGGKAGLLAWMEYRNPDKKQKPYYYPFTERYCDFRMTKGALYPILAAFRWYVKYADDKTTMVWKIPFDEVVEAWRAASMQLLRATAEMCDELGNNPNALGKSKSNWGNMHNILKAYDLQSRQN